MNAAVRPFTVQVSDADIADVRQRLRDTRWPREEPANAGWDFGADMDQVRDLCAHWADGFDWRMVEHQINRFDNFHATVDGLDIHFIHEKGSGEHPLPLILTHGWPGSIVEFLDVIEPLAHPERFGGQAADGFDVIVPSLPGYGFSAAPPRPVDCRETARLWRHLMVDVLGYDRFMAQGGDWGSLVTSWLGLAHGDVCCGIHQNMFIMQPRDRSDPDTEEQAWLKRRQANMRLETAYQAIQSTKPQTLSYGLNDSPAGLAAWILEKFHRWGDTHGDVASRFSRDHLLANIALYWHTGTINSSTWMYTSIVESDNFQPPEGKRIEVPVGVAHFPGDTFAMPPRQWVERLANVIHWTDMPAGGHFAAMEEPAAFIDDVRAFARLLR
ncbi:MAG: epoxide hydrolase [Minwuia sp.]|nr:epoxide hydrolase [Minwuia sp.]